MTIDEKTHLLLKDYQKSYVIPIPQEDLNNNTTEESLSVYDSYALTKAELAAYIDDPFWVRVRYICFSVYWLLCTVALFVSCYIAVSALEDGFCVPTTSGPINGDNVSAASISSTTSATSLVTTTLMSATGSEPSGGVIFRLLDQPSSS